MLVFLFMELTGDELVAVLAALANPHRLRVLAALSRRRAYVSSLELSEDGKAMKFYEVTPFALRLTPETVAAAASTLSPAEKEQTR